jgi:hypothetical protein
MDPRGDTAVAWAEKSGGKEIVATAQRPAGGRWHHRALPSDVTDTGVGDVAMDRRGSISVTWTEDAWTPASGDHFTVKAARRPAGGHWHHPATLSAPGTQAHDPHVAMAGDGIITVTWARFRIKNGRFAGTIDIQGRQRVGAGPWGGIVSLSDGHAGDNARVAMDRRGHAVAVWTQPKGTTGRVMVSTSS